MSKQLNWVNYKIYTGEILMCFTATKEEADMNRPSGTANIENKSVSSKEFYIKDGKAISRPLVVPEINGLTVTSLPPNGKVTINGKEYDYVGVTIEFSFPYVGEYNIEIRSWPYRDCFFTLRKE